MPSNVLLLIRLDKERSLTCQTVLNIQKRNIGFLSFILSLTIPQYRDSMTMTHAKHHRIMFFNLKIWMTSCAIITMWMYMYMLCLVNLLTWLSSMSDQFMETAHLPIHAHEDCTLVHTSNWQYRVQNSGTPPVTPSPLLPV